jgi:3D (Asp-Asp-Asp) domain-containing protein
MRLTATAYCDHGTTDSGAQTRRWTMAADPRVLPIGSVVRIESPERQYSGTYTVTDTGAKVKGRKVDLFVPSCAKARQFGKRRVLARVLRRGPTANASPR